MLKSWSIKNFKPIVDSGELQLAPVTVLAGRNSSGKSSLLQSILMITQTLGSRLLDRPLLPNERLVQLGTFEDILSEYSDAKTLIIGFKLEFENEEFLLYNMIKEPITLLESQKQYGENLDLDNYEEPDINSFPENNEEAKVSLTFQSENRTDTDLLSVVEAPKISISAASVDIIPFNGFGRSYAGEPDRFDLNFKKITKQDHDEIAKKFKDSKERKKFLDDIKTLDYIGEFYGATFLLSLSHFLPRALRKIPVESEKQVVSEEQKKNLKKMKVVSTFELRGGYAHLIHDFSNSIARIEDFFTSKVRYLGPLRADPGTIQQQFAPTSELDNVGIKGEHAAIVYHTNKNALIDWYNPETQQLENGALQKALDVWAHYLNIADHVGTEEAGAIGITWQVVPKEGRKPRSLPEVGVGISQILPILVMGLLSPANTLLIIEQPELHLHPYVQARLGDFFMGLAKCKKQCLIETHSENLVSQLRLHIVEAGGLEKSDCMVYFVDQDEKGAAQFKKVEISPRGNILNWPDGFFDETLLQQDRITEESLKQRAKLAAHE